MKLGRILFLIFVFLPHHSWAEKVSYSFSNLHGKRQLTFYSKTHKEGFEGEPKQFDGFMTIDYGKKVSILDGSLSFPVMSMKTGITLRDVHMRGKEWLNENRYPTIQLILSEPKKQSVRPKGKKKLFVKMQGILTIKGRSQEIEVPLSLKRTWKKKKERLYVRGGFKVHLADYGIRGPVAMQMVGSRVNPDIEISVNLVGHAN